MQELVPAVDLFWTVLTESLKVPPFKVYRLTRVKCVFSCVGCLEVLTTQFIEAQKTSCPHVFRNSNPFKEPLMTVSPRLSFLNSYCEEKFEDKVDVLFFFLHQYLQNKQVQWAKSIHGLCSDLFLEPNSRAVSSIKN